MQSCVLGRQHSMILPAQKSLVRSSHNSRELEVLSTNLQKFSCLKLGKRRSSIFLVFVHSTLNLSTSLFLKSWITGCLSRNSCLILQEGSGTEHPCLHPSWQMCRALEGARELVVHYELSARSVLLSRERSKARSGPTGGETESSAPAFGPPPAASPSGFLHHGHGSVSGSSRCP